MNYTPPITPPTRPVSDEGSLRAFEHYRDLLIGMGYVAHNEAELPAHFEEGDPTDPRHLLWMCEHCVNQVRDDGKGFNVAKYSRWLGYVQGCLISQGITTVKEERNRTRPWFADQ